MSYLRMHSAAFNDKKWAKKGKSPGEITRSKIHQGRSRKKKKVSSFSRKVGPSYKIKKDAKKGVNGKADYSTNTSAIYMKYSSEEPLEKVLHGNVFVYRISWNF